MRNLITLTFLFFATFSFATEIKVIRVIDGDTFETELGEKVRLIGINAPELSDVFGEEAKIHLTKLIENKNVELQNDNISNNRDRYQRLLRYVILEGVDINKRMILDGFAFAYLKYHFSKSNEYKEAQIQSRESNNGIWGDSQNDKTINHQKKITLQKTMSIKGYLIISLMLILIFFGLYTFFKR